MFILTLAFIMFGSLVIICGCVVYRYSLVELERLRQETISVLQGRSNDSVDVDLETIFLPEDYDLNSGADIDCWMVESLPRARENGGEIVVGEFYFYVDEINYKDENLSLELAKRNEDTGEWEWNRYITHDLKVKVLKVIYVLDKSALHNSKKYCDKILKKKEIVDIQGVQLIVRS